MTKLNSDGTALIYSTYLGGTAPEIGRGIALDGSGNTYITGQANSIDFPTTIGAYQDTSYGEGNTQEIFATKLNPSGDSLV